MIVIVNGQVISKDSSDNTSGKKISEEKKQYAGDVKHISINSDISVKVCASDTTYVTAYMQGFTAGDESPKLSITKYEDEIRVCVESPEGWDNNSINIVNNSINIGKSVVTNSFSINCDLSVCIQIPNNNIKSLGVHSKNANINIDSSVNVNKIDIDSKNGSIDVYAAFNTLNAECKNGDINVDSNAKNDVILDLLSKNGDVDVSISNIGVSKVSVDSKNGTSRNVPKLRGIYTAVGYISSKNGDVKFH